MKIKFTKFAALAGVCLLMGCDKGVPAPQEWSSKMQPVSTPVVPAITEASGIADSKRNPGYLWVHEDSGKPAQLYLLSHDGLTAKTMYLQGATNRDWEDIVLSGDDLYVADIGDNAAVHDVYTIYKFPEPAATTDTVKQYEKIQFRYPDGAHDAEAFLVDPVSKDIYIFTKRDKPGRIYKLSYPYSSGKVVTAEPAGVLAQQGVVSAALSADGTEIILKTYTNLYHYSRSGVEPIEKTLQQHYTRLTYLMEPQGEAVTFATNGKGYFTLSEQVLQEPIKLHFYHKP
ncbi:MAG TPA: hypothetical protein VIG72_01800 [Pontibacter sp.]